LLFVRYELPVPENPWPGAVARFASVQAACEAGAAAEIANGEMYDRPLMAIPAPGHPYGIAQSAGGVATAPPGCVSVLCATFGEW
jgi:hypothetical protein